MKFGLNELKRPNACVLILLLLMPVLALLTTADNAAAATCACPYGGQYFSSIYTSLCGWQYNVCVTWDYNCANDYPAVCGTTQTRTTRATSARTVQTTTTRTSTARTTACNSYLDYFVYIEGIAQYVGCPHATIQLTRPTQVTLNTGYAKCDPSYPTVCIPPPPPDLDCKDIPYRRFRVLPPDPHHFDGDFDGIGCEWD